MPSWLLVLLCAGSVVRLTRLVTEDVLFQPFRRFVIRHRPAPPTPKAGDLPGQDQAPDEDWLVYLVHCRWCASIWIAAGVAPLLWFWPQHWFTQIPTIGLTASLLAGLSARWE